MEPGRGDEMNRAAGKDDLGSVPVEGEASIVEVRDVTREIAGRLGFSGTDQVRITTAVSEVVRNIYEYAGTGEITFSLVERGRKSGLRIVARDRGPGMPRLQEVLSGRYVSPTGLGVGILGARALMDDFEIESAPGEGTTVRMLKWLPGRVEPLAGAREEIRKAVAERPRATPEAAIRELQGQNRELLDLMQSLNQANERLAQVNEELAETNRGVVSLNSMLEARNEEMGSLNEALQTANRRLAGRNADLKTFAYSVSHDLKAPLRAIGGYARELDRRHSDGLGERGIFCTRQVTEAVTRLDALIDDLLRYTRLEAEAVSAREVDLRAVLDAILRDLDPVVVELGAQVAVELEVERVICWERGLTQVLINLLDNALKYSSRSPKPRVEVTVTLAEGGIRFQVSDNGIGFDMARHDKLFELFRRMVQPEEYKGTGAGLAIVKKLVEMMNGKVWAESGPGRGATFYVEIPPAEAGRGTQDASQ